MPGKVKPAQSEALTMLATRVLGTDASVVPWHVIRFHHECGVPCLFGKSYSHVKKFLFGSILIIVLIESNATA